MRPPDGDHFVMLLSFVIQVDESKIHESTLRETVTILNRWGRYVDA
jgi:hypothetical protein